MFTAFPPPECRANNVASVAEGDGGGEVWGGGGVVEWEVGRAVLRMGRRWGG